jgi:hypothetical protein
MTGNLFDRIVSQRGSFAGLLSRIPLLGEHIENYFDMDAQRDADRIVREHIAGLLRDQLKRMTEAENVILDSGGLTSMGKTRRVKEKLQTLADRIYTAAPGYAVTGALKIGEEQLAQVFAFDEAMLRYTDQVTELMDTLVAAAQSGEGVDEALAAMRSVIDEAGEAFSLRKDVLSGLA